MAVAALSTAGFSQYVALSSNISSSQSSFGILGQSLTQGNLTSAATALTALQKALSTSSGYSANSQLGTDLNTLSSAISSGSLTNAQSAYQTVATDLKGDSALQIANAQTAAQQTVQWIDDLLNLGSSSTSSSSTTYDPISSILNAALGNSNTTSSSTSSDPTTAVLSSVYGTGTGTSANSTGTTSSSSSTGNSGSGSSVNVYA